MNIKKTFLSVITILLIFFGVIFPSSTIADEEEPSKFWKNIFLEHVKNFEYHSKDIDYLIFRIHDDLEEFRVVTKKYDTKYHQLKFIMNNVINNPYEYRLVITEMANLSNTYTDLYEQILTLGTTADTYISSLKEMKSDLKYLTKEKFHTPEVLAASNRLLFDINILIAHLTLEKNQIHRSIVSMKIFIKKLTSMSDFLKDSFFKQLKMYFLVPGPTIWEIKWNDLLPYSLNSWINTLPSILKARFPDEVKEYLSLTFMLGLALGIYLIFHYLLIKKINIHKKIPNAYELLLRALAALFIFLGLCATSAVLIFPETVLFYRLGVIIFGFFAWFFSLALKVIQSPDTSDDSTLSALFILFSCGILYQLFGINYIMLAVIWPITILLTMLFLFIKSYLKNKVFINTSTSIFYPIALIFIIICINGYIYMSVFCCMVWFLIVITFRLGAALSWILRRFVENLKKTHNLLVTIITGVGIPLVWLLVFLMFFFWVSMQISSSSYLMFHYLTNLNINIQNHKINVFSILIAVFLFFVFKCFIDSFIDYLNRNTYTTQKQRHQALPSLRTITRYTGWIIYILLIMFIFNINITSILVVLGGLSVGIGFGLKEVISNFICGLIIIFGKTCRPGDIIELDGALGTVTKTEIRNTTIRTLDNCIITIPNTFLLDSKLQNWTRNNDLVRKDITVGVDYNTDIDLTTKLLLEIAESFDEICKTPHPKVLFEEFGDSALIFNLRIWLHDIDNIFVIPSSVRYAIKKSFNKNGISIAYPQLDLHVKEITSSEALKIKKQVT